MTNIIKGDFDHHPDTLASPLGFGRTFNQKLDVSHPSVCCQTFLSTKILLWSNDRRIIDYKDTEGSLAPSQFVSVMALNSQTYA